MLQRMSIGQWFKDLFSGSSRTDASSDIANETGEMIDIDEARMDAGGSGIIGTATHESPGEEAGEREGE
jgi:hypothetical protein